MSGWIGADLDCTLAHYDGWKGKDEHSSYYSLSMKQLKSLIKLQKEL